jgi:hypothetical protein
LLLGALEDRDRAVVLKNDARIWNRWQIQSEPAGKAKAVRAARRAGGA